MPRQDYPDLQTLFGEFTTSKRGRARAVTYKRPRDRLIDSLGNQIEMVHFLKEGRDPKAEGRKERRMFFEERGRYIVQIKYNNNPLNFLPNADTAEVETLEQVEKMLNNAITAANAGYFDEQISQISAEWSATRKGKRGAKEPEQEPAEEA